MLREAIAALDRSGLTVKGVLQEPVFEEGTRVGETIVRMGTEERVLIARVASAASRPSEALFCGRVFDLDTFRRARHWLEDDAAGAEVVVIDDVSKLEVSGSGHFDAVGDAMARSKVVVLSIRGDQLFAALERFALAEPVAVLDDDTSQDVAVFARAVALAAGRA